MKANAVNIFCGQRISAKLERINDGNKTAGLASGRSFLTANY